MSLYLIWCTFRWTAMYIRWIYVLSPIIVFPENNMFFLATFQVLKKSWSDTFHVVNSGTLPLNIKVHKEKFVITHGIYVESTPLFLVEFELDFSTAFLFASAKGRFLNSDQNSTNGINNISKICPTNLFEATQNDILIFIYG